MRGYVQTLEAMVALGVAALAMTIILSPQTFQNGTDLKDVYFDCIRSIDDVGTLRYYVEHNMDIELSNDLQNCLPGSVDFSVKICSTSDCTAFVPDDKSVQSYNYYIAGYEDPNPKMIKAWLWL